MIQSPSRFTKNSKERLLYFKWSKYSLTDLIHNNAPCKIYFSAEESYPIITFNLDISKSLLNQSEATKENLFGKMKSLLFRGSRANILIEKKVNQLGNISPKHEKILKIGKVIRSYFSGYELKIISEDYDTNPEHIILKSIITPIQSRQLTELMNIFNDYIDTDKKHRRIDAKTK